MPTINEHLIYKALVALDEVIHRCRGGVIRRDFALRFVLAYLYAVSDGRREPYHDFWTTIQDPFSSSLDGGRYLRPTAATTNLNGIISGLGFNSTPALIDAISARNEPGRFWAEVQRQIDQCDPMPPFGANRSRRRS